MKKLFSVLAIAAAGMFAMVSCDKKDNETPISETVAGKYTVYCDITATPEGSEEGINFSNIEAELTLTKDTDTSVKAAFANLQLPVSEKPMSGTVSTMALTGEEGKVNVASTTASKIKFSLDGENELEEDIVVKGSINAKTGTVEGTTVNDLQDLKLAMEFSVKVEEVTYSVKIDMHNDSSKVPAEK